MPPEIEKHLQQGLMGGSRGVGGAVFCCITPTEYLAKITVFLKIFAQNYTKWLIYAECK